MEEPEDGGLCATPASRQQTQAVMRRVGDKWSVVVMTRLSGGPQRFTAILDSVDGLSHRMLSHTLRLLESDGFVSRSAFAEVPPRVEYALTTAGTELLSHLTSLTAWTEHR